MLDNSISLVSILTSLESVLKIEYLNDSKVEDVIRRAIEELENTYSVSFTTDLFSMQEANQLTSSKLDTLVRDITQVLGQLSLFIQLKLYHKNVPIQLADVNYLGYAKQQLLTSLAYLQDEKEAITQRDEIITPLISTLNNLGMSSIKRLFISMFVLNKLGVYEGVSIIAQFLYLGGLVS